MGPNKKTTSFFSKKWYLYWKKEKRYSERIAMKIQRKVEEEERKKIEKESKILELKRQNNLAIDEFCKKENWVQSEKNILGILSKTEIEILVRYACKLFRGATDDSHFYIIDRDRNDPYTRPQRINFQNINKISLLERYLKATPQIYKLEDLREYLKGDRKNKKILNVSINDFDESNFSQMINHYHYDKNTYLFNVIHHLLRDRVLLITYIDKLKNCNSNKKLQLKWDLNETQIVYLHSQFIDKEIVHLNISLGLFYQIFNNQLADFETPIQIDPKKLACFLFWSKEKNILLNKQPFKIIESLKMFCNVDGKSVTAHNLNRYVSEYKTEFIECTKPEYEKIKEIMDKV